MDRKFGVVYYWNNQPGRYTVIGPFPDAASAREYREKLTFSFQYTDLSAQIRGGLESAEMIGDYVWVPPDIYPIELEQLERLMDRHDGFQS